MQVLVELVLHHRGAQRREAVVLMPTSTSGFGSDNTAVLF